MMYRVTQRKDFPVIEKMNAGEFYFRVGDLSIVDGVIEDDTGKVVAFGIVKPFAEAVFICDQDEPRVTRGKALNMLMDTAIAGTRARNLRQLHVFVSDPKLAEALKKHHGFELCPEMVLVKTLI